MYRYLMPATVTWLASPSKNAINCCAVSMRFWSLAPSSSAVLHGMRAYNQTVRSGVAERSSPYSLAGLMKLSGR